MRKVLGRFGVRVDGLHESGRPVVPAHHCPRFDAGGDASG
jgi:hypothetical protein